MGGSEGTNHHQQLQIMLTKADIVEDYVLSENAITRMSAQTGLGTRA